MSATKLWCGSQTHAVGAPRRRTTSAWLSGRCCGRVATTHAVPPSAPASGLQAPNRHSSESTDAPNTTDLPHQSAEQLCGGGSTASSGWRGTSGEQLVVSRRQALGVLVASLAAIGGGSCLLPPSSTAEDMLTTAAAAAGATAAPPGAAEGAAAMAEAVACFVSPGGAADSYSTQLPPGAAQAARFTSVVEAVAACPSGGVVLVAAGRYRERLVLRNQAVTIKAWPQGAEVELLWETVQPYESTVDISGGTSAALGGSGGQVVLEGLTIRHASKSVANNFGVYVHGACSPRLLDCDISSRTGAGVGVEGASPWLLGCRVHDCARQGLAIFGGGAELMADLNLDLSLDPAVDPGLLTGMTGGVVQGCDVYGNALDGVLVRGGAAPDLMDNKVHDNKGSGFNLQDCGGRYSGNVVYDNARGAVSVSPLFELDSGDLAGSNSLRGLLRRL